MTVGSVSLRRHDPDQVLRVPTSRRYPIPMNAWRRWCLSPLSGHPSEWP